MVSTSILELEVKAEVDTEVEVDGVAVQAEVVEGEA